MKDRKEDELKIKNDGTTYKGIRLYKIISIMSYLIIKSFRRHKIFYFIFNSFEASLNL